MPLRGTYLASKSWTRWLHEQEPRLPDVVVHRRQLRPSPQLSLLAPFFALKAVLRVLLLGFHALLQFTRVCIDGCPVSDHSCLRWSPPHNTPSAQRSDEQRVHDEMGKSASRRHICTSTSLSFTGFPFHIRIRTAPWCVLADSFSSLTRRASDVRVAVWHRSFSSRLSFLLSKVHTRPKKNGALERTQCRGAA